MLTYFINNLEEFRKNMFKDEKIYLAGHSFGGFLGIKINTSIIIIKKIYFNYYKKKYINIHIFLIILKIYYS